eukprot:NODE_217_length_2200_cov_90.835890_g143_i0.p1 GENE.NODE_217_length_2200_cov_90.835890_g143_i0~~NODE_217_length_2200_cov_90.835890_g143_i0.p1  ORF type:complete len:643 (+),score=218.83 NODE_217_length_2200_cov_90.835890_g143_i0:76-1929(+)
MMWLFGGTAQSEPKPDTPSAAEAEDVDSNLENNYENVFTKQELDSRLAEVQQSRKELEKELRLAKAQNSAMTNSISSKEGKLSVVSTTMKRQADAEKGRRLQLEGELEATKVLLAKGRKQELRLEQQVKDLKAEWDATHEKQQNQILGLTAQLAESQTQLAFQVDVVESQKQALGEQEVHVCELQQALEKANQEKAEQVGTLKGLEEKVKALSTVQDTLSRLQAYSDSVEQALADSKKHIQHLEDQLASVTSESCQANERLSEEATGLTQKLATCQMNLEVQLEVVESQRMALAEKESHVHSLQQTTSKQQGEQLDANKVLTDKVQSLTIENSALQSALQRVGEQSNNVTQELAHSKSQEKQLQQHLADSTQANARLQKELAEHMATCTGKLEQQSEVMDVQRKRLAQQDMSVQTLQQAQEKANSVHAQQLSTNKQLVSRVQALTIENGALQSTIQRVGDERSTLQKTVTELRALECTKNNQIQALTAQRDDLGKEKAEMAAAFEIESMRLHNAIRISTASDRKPEDLVEDLGEVAVMCTRDVNCHHPIFEAKLNVPSELTVGDLVEHLRAKLQLGRTTSLQLKVVKGSILDVESVLASVHATYASKEGVLDVVYCS